MKYLGINLTKYVQDLHEESYKTLMKEIKEELNKWRDSPYSWIGRLNIVKMLVLTNLSYRFNAVLVKTPASCFVDLHTLILKFTWGLPWWRSGWESACQCRRHGFRPWSGRIPHAAEQLGLCATAAEPVLWSPQFTTTEALAPGARALQRGRPLQ